MDKLRKQIIIITALSIVALLSAPAAASLTGMTFGFPVIVQSGNTVSFSNDVRSAVDLESINIDFPMFNGMMAGSGISAGGIALNSMPDMSSLFDFSGFRLR